MTCPRCLALMRREPAAVHCVSCGERVEVIDADDDARLRQRIIDIERRPRSAECLPELGEAVASPPRPGRGWVKLPGPGQPNGRAASRAGPLVQAGTPSCLRTGCGGRRRGSERHTRIRVARAQIRQLGAR
jgi:hypothetical protein